MSLNIFHFIAEIRGGKLFVANRPFVFAVKDKERVYIIGRVLKGA